MKLLIAADLHGSALYTRELLSRYEEEKADKLILLGDILYHGPRNDLPDEYAPKQVIALLNPLASRILCVRGNCDSEVDQMVLSFPIMADYALMLWHNRYIFITHGHLFNLDHLPPLGPNDILLHGHTHIPSWTSFGQNNIYLNPGSVSIPKQNSPHSYMILDDHGFQWKDLTGSVYHEWTDSL